MRLIRAGIGLALVLQSAIPAVCAVLCWSSVCCGAGPARVAAPAPCEADCCHHDSNAVTASAPAKRCCEIAATQPANTKRADWSQRANPAAEPNPVASPTVFLSSPAATAAVSTDLHLRWLNPTANPRAPPASGRPQLVVSQPN